MRRMIALGGLAILLASCGASGPATDACGPWRAIYVAKADTLTEDTARALLSHNRTGAALCGWGR
jgi:hypothetical protein